MTASEKFIPKSIREGRREPFNLVAGVPKYVYGGLNAWFIRCFPTAGGFYHPSATDARALLHMAATLRLDFQEQSADYVYRAIANNEVWMTDPDTYLDIIDYLLFHRRGKHQEVEEILAAAGHEYRVSDDGRRLVKRVDDTVWATYEKARSANDRASEWIASAWAKTYSRDRDPSGAWEDARKAIEEVLKPIVSPNHARATISSMAQEIRVAQHKWECDLRGTKNESAVLQFARSLEVIGYPGDHHGGGDGKVEPEVSRTAVLQAVTVVGWLRDGAFRRIQEP